MREIKFRAWDNLTNEMIGDIVLGDTFDNILNYEFMQFTGLHDKNRKKIWEGDITFSKWNKPHVGRDDGTKRVVIWSNRLGGWAESNDGKDGEWVSHLKTHALPQTRVIGNIYENPNLSPRPSTP